MESLGGACPYAVLGIPENATDGEIRKAYLKAALKAHPDKNRGKPDAAEVFHRLVSAYDILSDDDAKGAYDRVLKLKQAAKLRDLALSAEQRKAKEDLERRESEFKRRRTNQGDAKRRLEAEIIRLREEGERRLQEEYDKASRSAAMDVDVDPGHPADQRQTDLKVKWRTKGLDAVNGGYSTETLERLFRKYGPVTVVMAKKEGKAILTFVAAEDAETALQCEQGLAGNPLQECKWVTGSDGAPDGHGSTPFAVPQEDLAQLEAEMFSNLKRAAAQGAVGST
eukprot:m.459901 g.459901  ORF g.459901 m.459901 type:complete len:282 (-) comp21854_c0_seq1:85-930(-)